MYSYDTESVYQALKVPVYQRSGLYSISEAVYILSAKRSYSRERSSLSLLVIIRIDQVHGLHALVDIDERSHEDQEAQYVPEPEGACAEAVVNTATL